MSQGVNNVSHRVFVMGATGNVGRSLVAALASSGENVCAASRTPASADRRANRTVRWVRFDLEVPATFCNAVVGCDRMFLMSRPGDEKADQFAGPLLKAVSESGIRHIVNLSAMGTEERPDFSLRKVEQLVENTGIPYTHLRPNFFMQVYSAGAIRESIRTSGKMMLPAADARLSLIDASDVATVSARILGDSHSHENCAYTLTGRQAISHGEIADIIGQATGRDVQYVPVDDNVMSGLLKSIGLPDDRVARLLGMYRLVRLGKCEPVDPAVERILGRPANKFDDFVQQHVDAWN